MSISQIERYAKIDQVRAAQDEAWSSGVSEKVNRPDLAGASPSGRLERGYSASALKSASFVPKLVPHHKCISSASDHTSYIDNREEVFRPLSEPPLPRVTVRQLPSTSAESVERAVPVSNPQNSSRQGSDQRGLASQLSSGEGDQSLSSKEDLVNRLVFVNEKDQIALSLQPQGKAKLQAALPGDPLQYEIDPFVGSQLNRGLSANSQGGAVFLRA